MPEPVHYDMWDALAALGIAASSALATIGGLVGIQKKNGYGVRTAQDQNSAEIQDLKSRCKDLENAVDHLKEKVHEQKDALEKADERYIGVFNTLFTKLDEMNKTLVKIQIAVGVHEGR